VLFVSHEATRTGAPKIILNILRHFREHCDIQCETILHNGGHLASEFRKYSEVACLGLSRQQSDELQRKIRRLLSSPKSDQPILALCNSMESRFIGAELAEHGIPIISLIHELPTSYTDQDYCNVFSYSKKIVFPVHFVRDATDIKSPIPHGKGVVLPQGLLNPNFGSSITREQAYRQIRKELSLPHDAFIAMGCGTLDLRKGIDHFVAIARRVVQLNDPAIPIHFVWVGDGPRWTHSPFHYLQLDLEKSAAKPFVHFIGERENVEPYFVGSDAFVLSSRVDPFPCVIHEAMATSLPVITFDQSGGSKEAVSGGAGFIVPYGDYDLTANIIRMLATQPEIAASLRQRSLERVQARYRFEHYGDQLIHLAESVIGRPIRKPLNRKDDLANPDDAARNFASYPSSKRAA
jgi:glycosyltransferase involved in cell wall biosynthesis